MIYHVNICLLKFLVITHRLETKVCTQNELDNLKTFKKSGALGDFSNHILLEWKINANFLTWLAFHFHNKILTLVEWLFL